MPAESKSQARLFGMVHAYQKGKLKKAPLKVRQMAKRISPEDATDFAKTKHDGLPEKKTASLDLNRVMLNLLMLAETGFLSKEAACKVRAMVRTRVTKIKKKK